MQLAYNSVTKLSHFIFSDSDTLPGSNALVEANFFFPFFLINNILCLTLPEVFSFLG